MGTKFGNIHVKTSHVNEVITALKELVSERNIGTMSSNADLSGFEAMLNEANETRNIFYVGHMQTEWVSILNDWFGWGETESFGEQLSSYLASPVLTCSCFDEDLLEIHVYRNGAHVTGQLWCSAYTREDYGLEEKEADPSILAELLGHAHLEKIMQALHHDDLEEVVQEFEAMLEIPLWIKSDWLEDANDDEIASKYVKYSFNT